MRKNKISHLIAKWDAIVIGDTKKADKSGIRPDQEAVILFKHLDDLHKQIEKYKHDYRNKGKNNYLSKKYFELYQLIKHSAQLFPIIKVSDMTNSRDPGIRQITFNQKIDSATRTNTHQSQYFDKLLSFLPPEKILPDPIELSSENLARDFLSLAAGQNHQEALKLLQIEQTRLILKSLQEVNLVGLPYIELDHEEMQTASNKTYNKLIPALKNIDTFLLDMQKNPDKILSLCQSGNDDPYNLAVRAICKITMLDKTYGTHLKEYFTQEGQGNIYTIIRTLLDNDPKPDLTELEHYGPLNKIIEITNLQIRIEEQEKALVQYLNTDLPREYKELQRKCENGTHSSKEFGEKLESFANQITQMKISIKELVDEKVCLIKNIDRSCDVSEYETMSIDSEIRLLNSIADGLKNKKVNWENVSKWQEILKSARYRETKSPFHSKEAQRSIPLEVSPIPQLEDLATQIPPPSTPPSSPPPSPTQADRKQTPPPSTPQADGEQTPPPSTPQADGEQTPRPKKPRPGPPPRIDREKREKPKHLDTTQTENLRPRELFGEAKSNETNTTRISLKPDPSIARKIPGTRLSTRSDKIPGTRLSTRSATNELPPRPSYKAPSFQDSKENNPISQHHTQGAGMFANKRKLEPPKGAPPRPKKRPSIKK